MPGLTEQQRKGPRWRAEPGCSHETGLTLLCSSGLRPPTGSRKKGPGHGLLKSLALSPEKHHGLWTRHEHSATVIRV